MMHLHHTKMKELAHGASLRQPILNYLCQIAESIELRYSDYMGRNVLNVVLNDGERTQIDICKSRKSEIVVIGLGVRYTVHHILECQLYGTINKISPKLQEKLLQSA